MAPILHLNIFPWYFPKESITPLLIKTLSDHEMSSGTGLFFVFSATIRGMSQAPMRVQTEQDNRVSVKRLKLNLPLFLNFKILNPRFFFFFTNIKVYSA